MRESVRARGTLLVLAAWLLLVASLIFVREAMTPDEARFIQQSHEMRDSGAWFVPTIGEVPNADKPPMLFWLVNLASFWQSRISEGAARIPAALGALVVLFLTMRLGRRLWRRTEVGLAGALVLLTNNEFMHRAQWISCDMPLTVFSWLAITLWREAIFDDDDAPGAGGLLDHVTPRVKIAFGWLAASFAILSKGPVGLLWPLFWCIGEAWARRRGRPLGRLVQPAGIALFVLPIAAVLMLFARGAGSAKLFEATLTQTFARYVAAWNLVKPWYFYAHQLPLDFLPWTVLAPVAAVHLWRVRGGRGSDPDAIGGLSCFGFGLLGLVFFSISSGKRDVYLLPAYPAFALLVARAALVFSLPSSTASASMRPPCSEPTSTRSASM